jgi:CheY-like chemotaxis protein
VLFVGCEQAGPPPAGLAGYRPRYAAGLAEALAALESCAPAMVWVSDDLALPDGGSGIEALREKAADVPMVLVAAPQVSPEVLEASWKAGVDDCVFRPFQPPDVSDRLEALRAGGSRSLAGRRESRNVLVTGDDDAYRKRLCQLLALDGMCAVEIERLDDAARATIAELAPIHLIVAVTNPSNRIQLDTIAALSKVGRGPKDGRTVPLLVMVEREMGFSVSGVVALAKDTPADRVSRKINDLTGRATHELRAHQRAPFFCPVEFRDPSQPEQRWQPGYSHDISSGGIFVKTLLPPRPGSVVDVRIRLTTHRGQLSVAGLVAWSNPYGRRRRSQPAGMGIQFLGALSRELSQLIALCKSNAG